MNSVLRLLTTLLAVFVLNGAAWGQDQSSGSIEHLDFDSKNNTLHVLGKIWSKNRSTEPVSFVVFIQDSKGTVTKSEIIDIDDQEDLSNAQKFSLTATFKNDLKGGISDVALRAIFGKNNELLLNLTNGKKPSIHISRINDRHWLLLFFAFLIPFILSRNKILRRGRIIDNWINKNTKTLSIAILFLFLSLVSFGITGGSSRIGLNGPFGQAVVETTGSDFRIFKLRSDRGDEWGVLTPNVLAQIHHSPPFPITNTNLGLDGQNMGVIGMTGVPIIQWAALARPATWGYFLLPFRQAQAWQWQLPFWGCMLALWWLLNLLSPNQSGRNIALSFLFCISPYAAAWSNWPLYSTLFPIAALAIFISLLKSRNPKSILLWGISLGYAISAWVLTLYPPWIVSVGTVCAVIGTSWIYANREHLSVNKFHLAGFILSIGVLAALLGSWLLDTKDAINILQNTVYPGQRTTLTGGDNSLLWIFRGYTNPDAVTFGTGPWTNQSEISSYIIFPFAIFHLLLIGIIREKYNKTLIIGCAIFIAFYFLFVFIGIPQWLATASQWGRVPTNRGDVALGLAFIILLCFVKSNWFIYPSSTIWKSANNLLAGATITLSLWLVFSVLTNMPAFVFPKNSPIYTLSIVLFAATCVYWLIKGSLFPAIILLTLLSTISSIGYNPISKAPKNIEINSKSKDFTKDSNGNLLRVLVVGGDGIGPLTLASVGIPVVNGVLYYPHAKLWKQMKLSAGDWPVVNRYQHLSFTTENPPKNQTYSVKSPAMDWVVVTINSETFDFRETGAQRVAALEDQAISLRKSSILKEIGSHKGLVWFEVLASTQN